MNDAGDLLLRTRLEGIAAGGRDGDWGEVVRRVRRARRRRTLAFAAAAALVVVGVASALALTHPIVDFGSAEKGPQEIVVQFGRQNVTAPPGMEPGTLPKQARRIATVTIDGKPHVLYVAPTASGGFCWLWSNLTGSCRMQRELPNRILGGGLGGRAGFTSLNGDFLLAAGERLEVTYADGEKADVPFVWVTEPIAAGFYLYDVPAAHERAGHQAVALTLYDENGDALATEKLPDISGDAIPHVNHRIPNFGLISAPPQAVYAKRELLFDVAIGPHRHIGLWVAPGRDGGSWYWWNRGGGPGVEGSTSLSRAFLAKHPELRDAEPLLGLGMHGGNPPMLCCRVDPKVARVELRYQDGARETAIPKRGYLLVVLRSEHYALGHRLQGLVAYDAAGKVVGRLDMRPEQARGVYPCKRERDYGYGVKMCP